MLLNLSVLPFTLMTRSEKHSAHQNVLNILLLFLLVLCLNFFIIKSLIYLEFVLGIQGKM